MGHSRKNRRRLSRVFAAAAGLTSVTSAQAQTVASWLNAVDGSWTETARWSPSGVPTGTMTTAVIGAAGGPYQVNILSDVTIGTINIASPLATLRALQGGTFIRGARISGSGSLVFAFGATIDGITLATSARAIATTHVLNDLRLDGATVTLEGTEALRFTGNQ